MRERGKGKCGKDGERGKVMERRNEDKNKDKNKDKEKRTLLQSFCLRRMDKFLKNLIGEK